MKFGVDPPWYNDPIERMAFNLFAMSIEKEREKNDEEEDAEE
jgi:hypothetical protein